DRKHNADYRLARLLRPLQPDRPADFSHSGSNEIDPGHRQSPNSRPPERARSPASRVLLCSHPEILLQLIEVLDEIRVADHVDDAAVLDDVMAIGQGRGEV